MRFPYIVVNDNRYHFQFNGQYYGRKLKMGSSYHHVLECGRQHASFVIYKALELPFIESYKVFDNQWISVVSVDDMEFECSGDRRWDSVNKVAQKVLEFLCNNNKIHIKDMI